MGQGFANLPSVDEVLRGPAGQLCSARFGHAATLSEVRAGLEALRARLRADPAAAPDRSAAAEGLGRQALAALERADASRMVRVFNLTGTVLHTNLGRAIYADSAVEAATRAMRHPLALEYDLESGRRGQRDDAVQQLVSELTGAEDACLVNNNAAAVLLVLAALGQGRETIVSRGELIEIGGSFRMPAIMEAAGTRLREVGTTNRTHPQDYAGAIGPQTALLMKVHTSNYLIQGFTRETTTAELALLAREAGLPLVDDLGSGTLVDLSRWGLARERTVQDALRDGADLVTFSGDKLLGGPQAGFIVGRRDLVRACASHPIKRAVRLDKVRLAALEATLKLYRDPDRLAERLPTLAAFARGVEDLRALAARLAPAVAAATGRAVEIAETRSQIGSGALPLETIPSIALCLPAAGGEADRLAVAFRRLPIPVVGRLEGGAVLLDLRCLDDEDAFVAQLPAFGMEAPC
ncbi:L-seryl-tRNA(Sec) selenium transferase [Polymorphum gilvum]|uniref:L-seryl-tRNA(Sec) selenium transferase n=1 Tax=Polymorphum gilvum (strain LMG 25793 / CGMCC 1.9160 / SL003B-26A1) TaxID=991905 RepID=F2J1D0_POLGS|nr:L-seryl-tRNA(Sec) selenium transferase [Polymorphum gilvum]ADZ69712.1 Selenocysteine synthase [Polymorphum gilvum SL003B-26A1]